MIDPKEAERLVSELNVGLRRFEEIKHYHELALTLELEFKDVCRIRDEYSQQVQLLQKELSKLRSSAGFYLFIVNMVKEHHALQSIWDDLVVTMRLIDPDLENKFNHITKFGEQP
jgi:hypothetical protein